MAKDLLVSAVLALFVENHQIGRPAKFTDVVSGNHLLRRNMRVTAPRFAIGLGGSRNTTDSIYQDSW